MPNYNRTISLPGYSASDVYQKVSEGIEQVIQKLSVSGIQIDRIDETREVRLRSRMINAALKCDESRIHLDYSLSLMAVAFKSRIDDGIDQWIQSSFEKKS